MKTWTRAGPFLSRIGKAGQQALALQKIRRLASSSLPVCPFVFTLFDLIREAIPMGDTPQAISTDSIVGSFIDVFEPGPEQMGSDFVETYRRRWSYGAASLSTS
jgi:hypothetical protein